ncbi:MAG TPA: response regulator [Ktedonobacteraceae bacterium]|nr:response regulator [Ktedonobacteraceae bacterium]
MARIGLLEDNARIAKLCATMLQYMEHQVTIYGHPRECLRALLSPSSMYEGRHQAYRAALPGALPIDLLILDLHLPDIGGIEVLHYLLEHPHTKELPLIFCTAAPSSEIAEALTIAPHAGFIEKPFTFQLLTSTIMNALKEPA